jgi:hypothetical protein
LTMMRDNVPVGKLATLHFMLSFAAQDEWKNDHLDVIPAFLNPEIDKEVHMELPDGIEWLDESISESESNFLRLKKALYGLKQAPRLWHQAINSFLLSIEFHRLDADQNLYIRSDGVLVLLYVDDMLVFYADTASEKAMGVKEALMQQYKMSNLGPAKKFLGLEINRHPDGTITLGQQAYIEAVIRRFGMEDANTADTPLYHKTRLDSIPEDEPEVDPELYRSIVGSLGYAVQGTRPDLAYAVAALSRYSSKPYTTHMTAAKRVLRYLKKTADAKLVFPGPGRASDSGGASNSTVLVGYTDSDWASDRGDRKSQGGYIVQTYGAPVSWSSKKQTVVARSTTEAEYLACSEATREAQSLVYLHRDITGETVVPLIHCDSNGALSTIRSTASSDKAKHIDVAFHNSRHLDAEGIIKFTEISTHENLADVMTKALAPDKHRYFTRGIGLRQPTS